MSRLQRLVSCQHQNPQKMLIAGLTYNQLNYIFTWMYVDVYHVLALAVTTKMKKLMAYKYEVNGTHVHL